MHANEIVILAYYIASVNIENVYHDLARKNCRIDGLTDCRIEGLTGRKSVNQPIRQSDNNAYTPFEGICLTDKNALYDSYIKAFRWATDRLEGGKGIVAFISNAGCLDASAMDGFRATLREEFDSIYVFNLRGNQRTSGELTRKEGGKIFGSGSRTPIAILVRNGGRAGRATVPTGEGRGTRPACPSGTFSITKMRFAKKEHPVDENGNGKLERWELEDRSRILYSDRVSIRGIPLAAYDYVVNGKSAIEWVMERYQVTTNKDSGIVNDPNKWLAECGNERYIVDLVCKNAYYFVDVVAERGPAPIYFNSSHPGRLGSPIVVALGGETSRVPMLIGAAYSITSDVPFTVACPTNGFAEVLGSDGMSATVKWPLEFTFTEELSVAGRSYTVGVEPYNPGGAFSWGGGQGGATLQGPLPPTGGACGCFSGTGNGNTVVFGSFFRLHGDCAIICPTRRSRERGYQGFRREQCSNNCKTISWCFRGRRICRSPKRWRTISVAL